MHGSFRMGSEEADFLRFFEFVSSEILQAVVPL